MHDCSTWCTYSCLGSRGKNIIIPSVDIHVMIKHLETTKFDFLVTGRDSVWTVLCY